MNVVTINGYVKGQIYYGPDTAMNNRVICNFAVATTTPCNQSVSLVPCKCVDWLADKCYAELSEGSYVEIIGELVKVAGKALFVQATSIIHQRAKDRRQICLRTTDFYQTYKPQQVLKRIKNYKPKEEKNGK